MTSNEQDTQYELTAATTQRESTLADQALTALILVFITNVGVLAVGLSAIAGIGSLLVLESVGITQYGDAPYFVVAFGGTAITWSIFFHYVRAEVTG